MKAIAIRSAIALLVLYVVATGALYVAMLQPPDTFGQIMKHMPVVGFMVLPFETLWNSARAGDLNVGDPAPDFELKSLPPEAPKASDARALAAELDSPSVRLSRFRGQKPVVLVFGSYT